MKKIGTLNFNGRQVAIQEARYGNDRVAIALDEGMFGKLTVNLPDDPLPEGCIHVKMWDENERLREAALATGLFEDTGARVTTGMAKAEVWRYTSPAK